MSPSEGGSADPETSEGTQGNGPALERTEAQNKPINKGDTEPVRPCCRPQKVTQGAAEVHADEPCADKHNDKHNDKRAEGNAELAQVIDAWPRLPEAIRAGILAMVDAANPKGNER